MAQRRSSVLSAYSFWYLFLRVGNLEHPHLGVADRVGVVIHVDLLYVGLALLKIQMLDVVLLPPMDINGFFVHRGQRADKIHFANHEWPPRDINNDEIVAGDRAQADRVRRVRLMRPMIIFPRKMEVSRLRQSRA